MISTELIDQSCQFQQIRHAEERTVMAENDLRVRGHKIRPLRRNRAESPILSLQQQTPSLSVASLADVSERPPMEGMKRMRNADKTCRCGRRTCILDGVTSA